MFIADILFSELFMYAFINVSSVAAARRTQTSSVPNIDAVLSL